MQAIAQKSRSASKNKISSGTTQGISAGTTTISYPLSQYRKTTTGNIYDAGAPEAGVRQGSKSKNIIPGKTAIGVTTESGGWNPVTPGDHPSRNSNQVATPSTATINGFNYGNASTSTINGFNYGNTSTSTINGFNYGNTSTSTINGFNYGNATYPVVSNRQQKNFRGRH